MSIRQPHPREHSKAELLTSGRAKGDRTQGVGRDGKPVAGHFAEPGTEPLTPSHPNHSLGQHIEGHAAAGNIARDGAPKNFHTVPVHGGATEQQHSALRMGGSPQRGEGTPGADPTNPNPLSPGKEKQMARVTATPGMRTPGGTSPDALHELGQRILANAARNYSPHEDGALSDPKKGVNKF